MEASPKKNENQINQQIKQTQVVTEEKEDKKKEVMVERQFKLQLTLKQSRG